MTKSILIIEDEALLGMELKRYFERSGWLVELAPNLKETKNKLLKEEFHPPVVLADMNLPDGNSLDLLEDIKQHNIVGEWIFLTGYASVADSVRALKIGAYDFLEKPVDFQRLDLVVSGAMRSATAQIRIQDRQKTDTYHYTPESFVGQSESAKHVRMILGKLVETPISALIIGGETGTGKGVTAKILHYNGMRKTGPFIEVNCSALPKDLLESELFGHEAGSFTGAKGKRKGVFEQADGGTLFLDEIGEIPIELQAKLLKALEEKRFRRVGGEREISVDIQIIAATNRDLLSCIEEGTFREDLYHRLSVYQFRIPTLRERIMDLKELMPVFINEFNAQSGKKVSQISDAVWDKLNNHGWPGNVRELRNVVERCVLFSDDSEFPIQWLNLIPENNRGDKIVSNSDSDMVDANGKFVKIPLNGSMSLDEMDCFIINSALEQNDYNVTATARLLNTTRDTLRYRVSKYDIDLPQTE